MKPFTFLSATAMILTLSVIDANAQSDLKLLPDSPRLYHRVDSNSYQIDSNKFVKKPSYNEYNQPVALPNSFKSAQSTSTPMRIKKIPLAVPEDKKD
jgi:hypothetical protein